MCSIFLPDSRISNGNNFVVPFTAFCATGDGDCSDNCIDLDGVNDNLEVTGVSTNQDFTVTAWFKADPNTCLLYTSPSPRD